MILTPNPLSDSSLTIPYQIWLVVEQVLEQSFISAHERTVTEDHPSGVLVPYFMELTNRISLSEFFNNEIILWIIQGELLNFPHLRRAIHNLTSRVCLKLASSDIRIDRVCQLIVESEFPDISTYGEIKLSTKEKIIPSISMRIEHKTSRTDMELAANTAFDVLYNTRELMVIYCIMVIWPNLYTKLNIKRQ